MTTDTTLVPIHVRIPANVRRAVQLVAQDQDRNLSYIVRKALEEYLLRYCRDDDVV